MLWTNWIALSAFISALSVAAGAFAAHILKTKLSPYHFDLWETASRYQMYHGLALMGLGLVATRVENGFIQGSGFSLLFGMLIFCASLYGIALGGPRWLGAIAPIGGSLMILGWCLLGIAVLKGN